MRKIVLAILLVFLLSGCHRQTFTYGNSKINLEHELDTVLEMMMDKGNYNSGTLVPYDRVSLAIDYSTNQVVVEAVQFQVYRKFDGDEYHYDSTQCFDVNGLLECREIRGLFTTKEKTEEISLVESIDIFSSIDIVEIMDEITTHFSFIKRENLIIQAHFALPDGINENVERFDNVVYYYENQYHYEDNFVPSEMMIEIRVRSFGNGEGDTYILYYEME